MQHVTSNVGQCKDNEDPVGVPELILVENGASHQKVASAAPHHGQICQTVWDE